MNNWAIVIGVDRYDWTQDVWLRGAVRDALRMREWLLDPAGGAVTEDKLALLLSPRPGSDPLPAAAREATRAGVLTAIFDLLERSSRSGDRLYVYYAGHGLTARVSNRDENALLASDFTDQLTDNSCALRSLYEFFETTQFQDQFFFVDACRNVPWPGREIEIGRWTRPEQRNQGLPPAQQFILYATSPGLKALEVREQVGNERGAFTDVLLDGLRGKGAAKAWCEETGDYKVRWERLFRYVKDEMERRRLRLPDEVTKDVFQIPQQGGARGVAGRDPDPTLVAFPADAFDDEVLEVVLEPDAVVQAAAVEVTDLPGEPIETRTQITGLPVQFSLPPKTYAIHARAPEYQTARARPPVEVYGPEPKTVTMSLAEAEPVTEPPAAVAAPTAAGEAASSRLEVWSTDPLAVVEVATNAGAVLAVHQGSVQLRDLSPGFYRARLRTPEGELQEQLVELAAGDDERVDVSSADLGVTKPLLDLATHEAITVHDDHSVTVGDGSEPIVGARLSTVLSVAAAAAIGEPAGDAAQKLGLSRFRETFPADAESGAYLVLGSAAGGAASGLEEIGLRLWRFGEPVPEQMFRPVAVPGGAAVAELALPDRPGPYWLALEHPEAKPVVFNLALLPGRVALLVAEVHPGGRLRTFQFAPALREGPVDPEVIRRIELVERVSLADRLDLGFDGAQELIQVKRSDPIAGCLGGYLMLRLDKVDELEHAATFLTEHYGGLSDSHVIRAEFEARRGETAAAREAITTAIAVGVPIFGEGLTRLLDGLAEHCIDHDHAQVVARIFNHHLSGSLWSTWTPHRVVPGELLVTAKSAAP